MLSINKSNSTPINHAHLMKMEEVHLLISSFLLLVFLTCTLKLLNILWFKPKRLEKLLREQGLDGNPYRLLVGDALDLMSATKAEHSRNIPLSNDFPARALPFYKQIVDKYGNNPFMWFGSSPTILITDPHMMKEVFSKPYVYQKPVMDTIVESIAGGGLTFLEGDKWTLHRKIINPAFRMENLKNMTSTIGLVCSNMVDKWEALISNGESNEIEVWPYLYDLSGDIISRTAFGTTFEQGRIIFDLQREQMRIVFDRMPFHFIPTLRHFPTKASRRIKAHYKTIKSVLTDMISQREKEIENGESTRNDLLGMLMEANHKSIGEHENEASAGMSIDDVIEECKVFYFAGADTVSILLSWTLVLLSQHQEWQARAREEVLGVFGKGEPTFDGLSRLKVVTMILREVLRLYPPVPLTVRAPIETSTLGDLTIPVGVRVLLLIGLFHHDPQIWGDDVKEFNPERFSEGISSAAKTPFSFIPFSTGPRVCIGQHFAMIEAKMALSMILQRFEFDLSPSYIHDPLLVLTARPKYGVPLLFNKI